MLAKYMLIGKIYAHQVVLPLSHKKNPHIQNFVLYSWFRPCLEYFTNNKTITTTKANS